MFCTTFIIPEAVGVLQMYGCGFARKGGSMDSGLGTAFSKDFESSVNSVHPVVVADHRVFLLLASHRSIRGEVRTVRRHPCIKHFARSFTARSSRGSPEY